VFYDWNKQRSPRFVIGSVNIDQDSNRNGLQIKPQAIEMLAKPVENFSRMEQKYDQHEQISQRRD